MTRHLRSPATVITLAVIVVFFAAHHLDPQHPLLPAPQNGWWWWTDQSRYLASALAFADLDLDPTRHWYLPGYGLIAAPFVRLHGGDPFMLPNLACLLATLFCSARLAAHLAPHRRHGALLGALGVAAGFILSAWFRRAWVVPWSTTPTVPLSLACLLLTMRFQDAPTARTGGLIGVATAATALFRPTDAMLLALVLPPFMAAALIGRPWRAALRALAAGAAGFVLIASVAVALHVAIHGLAVGSYLDESAQVGFEWRLIGLRWVTLVISPGGLFSDGAGLAQRFVWVVPGLGGLAAGALGLLGGPRRRHVLVATFVAASMTLYLAYRDLHVPALWRYNNYHYFKAVLTLLLLSASLSAAELVLSRRRPAILAAMTAAIIALFAWRAEWRPRPGTATPIGPHTVAIDADFSHPGDALLLPVDGPFDALFVGDNHLASPTRLMHQNIDFKNLPIHGFILVELLRMLEPPPDRLTLDDRITLPGTPAPRFVALRARFGLPCWFARCNDRLSDGKPPV